jgi:hypothetical protein
MFDLKFANIADYIYNKVNIIKIISTRIQIWVICHDLNLRLVIKDGAQRKMKVKRMSQNSKTFQKFGRCKEVNPKHSQVRST